MDQPSLYIKDRFTLKSILVSLPDTQDIQKLSEEQVDEILTRVPQIKLAQNVKIINLESDLLEAGSELKKIKMVYTLQANQNKHKPGMSTAEGREAWVSLRKDVQEAQAKYDNISQELKMAKAVAVYCDDLFISARKIANKIEQQYVIEAEVAKYNKPLY